MVRVGIPSLVGFRKRGCAVALIMAPVAIAALPLPLLAQLGDPVSDTPPTVTTVLPENVAGVLLTDTTESAWSEFTQFQLFRLMEERIGIVPGPGGLTFLPPELDYVETVQPWIGDRAATVLMPARGDAAASENLLMIAPIARPAQFEGFIEQLQATRPELPTEQRYQGITILSWEPIEPPDWGSETESEEIPELSVPKVKTPDSAVPKAGTAPLIGIPVGVPPTSPSNAPAEFEPNGEFDPEALPSFGQPGLSVAVLPGFLVLAESPEPIQQLIDWKRKEPSLAEHPDFQRTMADPNFARSLLVGYGNLEEIAKFSALGIEPPAVPVPPPVPVPTPPIPSADTVLDALQPLSVAADAVEVFVYLQAEGLRSQSRIHFRQPQIAFAQLDSTEDLYPQIPAPTYALVSGRNLAQQWQAFSLALATNPQFEEGLQAFQSAFQMATGLDFETDLISWMNGEFSVFFFPSQYNAFDLFWPQFDVGIGVLVETRDRAAAEAALQRLDESISRLNLSAISSQVDGQSITSWEAPFASSEAGWSLLTRGWVGEDILVLTTGIEPMYRLNPQPLDPLTESYTFQAATASFPQPNQGYFYLNMGSTLALVYQLLPPAWKTGYFFNQAQEFLGSVRSFSATTSSTENYIQVDFLLGFAPTRSQ